MKTAINCLIPLFSNALLLKTRREKEVNAETGEIWSSLFIYLGAWMQKVYQNFFKQLLRVEKEQIIYLCECVWAVLFQPHLFGFFSTLRFRVMDTGMSKSGKKVFCSVIFQDFVPSDFKAHISRECCLGFLWAFPFVDSTILKVLVFVDYVIKPS